MVPANPNDRLPSDGPDPVPPVNRLAQRLRHAFDQHPGVFREEFLREAVRRDIHLRGQKATGKGAGLGRREGQGANRWSPAPPPLSAEDIRVHAWLLERQAVLHDERNGLWPRLRRFLFGNRLVRWLGSFCYHIVAAPGTRCRVSRGQGVPTRKG
jgi:hypothetical protein